MALTIKSKQELAIMIEDTEGVYKAPASGADYVQALEDNLEMTPNKELLDRSIMDGNLGMLTPRQGMSSVAGSIGVEMKTSGTEGGTPESSPLYRAAMGASRSFITKTSDDTDSGTPHTASRIYFLDGDAAVYNVGDIITTKRSGAYHTSPITAVSTSAGDNYIDLLVADPAGAYVDGIAITAGYTVYTANTGHPTLSISKYVEGAVLEQAAGCRVNSMSLNNFATGQLADVGFAFEGLNFDRSVTASPFTPSFDSAYPAVILSACVYLDGTAIDVSDVSISLENSLGFVSPTCSSTGRSSSRVASRTVSGSFTPYKQDDSVANFDRWNDSTEFSLFITAHVPTSTAGEYDQVMGWYLPVCMSTEIGETDADGILQDSISFRATRGSTGSSEEMYIGFS
jgi:hypothetical protein